MSFPAHETSMWCGRRRQGFKNGKKAPQASGDLGLEQVRAVCCQHTRLQRYRMLKGLDDKANLR